MIKFAQTIGSRPDLVPIEYIEVLSRLQDQVPPRPFPVVRRVLEHEYGDPSRIFAELDERPIAAASWAQVHRARLHDGRQVAVKIQYPGIRSVVDTDMSTIGLLLNILSRTERGLSFTPIIDELGEYIPMELDFLHEADNAERIGANFAGQPNVVVPEVMREHSTRKVLVSQYIDGIKISDLASLQRAGIDPQSVAQLLTETYCQQMLVHGLFNADPHPGNFLVLPGPKLVLLDFGLCRMLSEEFRRNYIRLTRAMLLHDPQEIIDSFHGLGVRTRTSDPAPLLLLREAFVDVAPPGKAYADADLVADVNIRLARMLRSNPLVEYPREVVLILKTVGLLSGVGRALDSRVDWIGTALRYVDSDMLPTAR
jgi:predicted unusual protein kinase regulating ubiquinone biosynthesis (AarF/ABC1/UbiB family)